MIRAIVFLGLALFLCSACDNDPSPDHPLSSLDSTYLYLQDSYYWNENLPSLKSFQPGSYPSPAEIIDRARQYSPMQTEFNSPVDRWSFAMRKEDWLAMLNSEASDFGLGMRFISESDLRIAWVQPNSSAGTNQLARGMKILKINDITAEAKNVESFTTILTTQDEMTLTIEDESGSKEVVVNKTAFTVSPVLKSTVFQVGAKKIGYLNLATFIESANSTFRTVFTTFKEEQIEELIIDLRYNGGGLMSVMDNLASYLVPAEAQNEVFYKIIYNKNYQAFNENVFFRINSESLPLTKIKFIVSPLTASCSEILIHSLKPHISTEVIGNTTQGKLYGMRPQELSGYIIVPLTFMVLNATETTREDGYRIQPDIISNDDLFTDFNEEEASIHIALYGEDTGGRKNVDQQKNDVYNKAFDRNTISFGILDR